MRGFPQDMDKALKMFHKAGELGYAGAYNNIGATYDFGEEGVKMNQKKAEYYYELAAMMGNAVARNNLGNFERIWKGNTDRALKHYMIAVKSGNSRSLEEIKRLYTKGQATKDDYMKALQLYQAYLGEIKSKQRDEAAAANEEKCRYY